VRKGIGAFRFDGFLVNVTLARVEEAKSVRPDFILLPGDTWIGVVAFWTHPEFWPRFSLCGA
jgi:hypothetical protein